MVHHVPERGNDSSAFADLGAINEDRVEEMSHTV
jgi:hypothetical protein